MSLLTILDIESIEWLDEFFIRDIMGQFLWFHMIEVSLIKLTIELVELETYMAVPNL